MRGVKKPSGKNPAGVKAGKPSDGAQQTGVSPRFPTVKTFLKSFDPDPKDWAPQPWHDERMADLLQYCSEPGRVYEKVGQTEFRNTLHRALGGVAPVLYRHRRYAIRLALSGQQDWPEWWRRSVAYRYWDDYVNAMVILHRFEQFKAGKMDRVQPVMFVSGLGAVLGDCIALGWLDWAVDLARPVWDALNAEPRLLFNDASARGPRAQHFVLRLIADWQGWTASERLPAVSLDEPVYRALLSEWRNPRATAVAPLLLAACDRHTHRSQRASGLDWDFSRDDLWYDPFEILSVLRLRKQLGLENPALEHPLLATPLGRLPEAAPPYCDALLATVLTQGRNEWPQLPKADWPGATKVKPAWLKPGPVPEELKPQWKFEISAPAKTKALPTPKTFCSRYRSEEEPRRRDESQLLAELKRYAKEGDFDLGRRMKIGPDRYDGGYAAYDLGNLAAICRWRATQEALGGKTGWQQEWQRSLMYAYWGRRHEIGKVPGEWDDYYGRNIKLRSLGPIVGGLLVQGWTEKAIDLCRRTRQAMHQGYIHSFHKALFASAHTQIFVLELIADWQGWKPLSGIEAINVLMPTHKCFEGVTKVPLFVELLAKWRTTNPDELAPLLLKACDRHVEQCGKDQLNTWPDLNLMDYWYDPFEILAVLRLRETLKLRNPVLDHPLLNTPLGVLPKPGPEHSDPLLKSILARATGFVRETEFPAGS